MFDIGWSEILVIAIVAIIVVGPRELPRMLRTIGKTMGTVRRTANDFKRQFDEALREAERDADLEGTRDTLKSLGNPIAGIKKSLNGPAVAKPAPAPVAAAAASSVEPAVSSDRSEALPPEQETLPYKRSTAGEALAHEAEPLKSGAAHPERGSDAA